jgi:hypothetical protein
MTQKEDAMSGKKEFYSTSEAVKITGVKSVQLKNYLLSKGMDAQNGLWPVKMIDEYAAGRRRAKLAAKIGYKNTRHLSESFESTCGCGAFDVTWNGKTICENGHVHANQ